MAADSLASACLKGRTPNRIGQSLDLVLTSLRYVRASDPVLKLVENDGRNGNFSRSARPQAFGDILIAFEEIDERVRFERVFRNASRELSSGSLALSSSAVGKSGQAPASSLTASGQDWSTWR